MYQGDLGQLIKKLKENQNGVAQDRLILCDIHFKLVNQRDVSHSRFHNMLVRFTNPHKDALIHRYERKYDYSVAQSKRNLIHTWDAFQCFTALSNDKDVSDAKLKKDKLMLMHKLIQKGDFNFVLTPNELDKIINIVFKYADENTAVNDALYQQVKSDYDDVVDFIAVLR